MDFEGVVDIVESLRRGDVVDLGQPSDYGGRFTRFDGQADMFDLVAFGAERDESFQPLDQFVVIIVPDFVALHGMGVASAATYLAPMPRSLEDDGL